MQKKIIFIFSLFVVSFCHFSCGGVFPVNIVYYFDLYDENDKPIEGEDQLKDFKFSLIDYCSNRKYPGDFSITTVSLNQYHYDLSFHLGSTGLSSTAAIWERRCKKELKETGVKIVDLKDRYKVYNIYPLSHYSVDYTYPATIKVKLEKK